MKQVILCLTGCMAMLCVIKAHAIECEVQALQANFPRNADFIRIPKGQIVDGIVDLITNKKTKKQQICQRKGYCFPYSLTIWNGPSKTRSTRVPAYRFVNCLVGSVSHQDDRLIFYTLRAKEKTYSPIPNYRNY